MSHLYIETNFLPRQARDKHRESTQKQDRFPPGASNGNATVTAIGKNFSAVAPPLLKTLRKSMAMDAFQNSSSAASAATGSGSSGAGAGPRCFPYVAGIKECGQLPNAASNRDSEPWRTYAEALYSGAIEPAVTAEILAWHQTQQGSGVKGSRLKLGVLSGCGGDVHCGDSLETFTIHGFGYGLLQADLVEECVLT